MTTWSEPDPLPEAAPAEIAVYDNLDRHRFEILSSGQLAGYSEYRDLPYGRAFVHTVVDSRCEGIGLGSELIKTGTGRGKRPTMQRDPALSVREAVLERPPRLPRPRGRSEALRTRSTA
jgi:predicted GNAT family acetyltransferase